jgi:catechol 2,3-dioxygenase-like lactoylglutathione lyase family enzyme
MKFTPGETNIVCTNAEASLKFYRDILGFEFIETEEGAHRLKCGNNYYLLLPFAKSKREKLPYCSVSEISIDLHVDNIAETAVYLKSNNVEFENGWKPGDIPLIIRDPDRLVIELIQI